MSIDSFVTGASLWTVQPTPSANCTVSSLLGDGSGNLPEGLMTLLELVLGIAELRRERETYPDGISAQVLQTMPESCRPWLLAKLNHICVTRTSSGDW